MCHKEPILYPFMPAILRLAATIWKCPDFLPEMSGILDTRIQTFYNSWAILGYLGAFQAILGYLCLSWPN